MLYALCLQSVLPVSCFLSAASPAQDKCTHMAKVNLVNLVVQLCLVLCLLVEMEEGSGCAAGLCFSLCLSILVLQPHPISFRVLGVYL